MTSMPKKQPIPPSPVELPRPEKEPEVAPIIDPEEPLMPEEDPEIIPDENPFDTPPYEIPPPAEGP